jgi:uncharacterized protein (TIGR03086 family)
MDDVEVLSGVLGKTGTLIAGVQPDQWALPTPCEEWDVRALVEHILGWMEVFDAGANGGAFEGDPADYRLGDDPAGAFRASAESMVEGWRAGGKDRTVRLTMGELPASMAFDMTLMEYMTHGWDLATATGQPVPFTDAEAEDVLARARGTLKPEYRGPDTAMGEETEAPAGASACTRLAAFMGRRVS